MRRLLIVAMLVASLVPAIARAQLIRGQVLESGSRQPLYGSIIVLLDSSGAQVAGAITDEHGRFTLPAPAPGRYSLRANRIGFRSTGSASFTLAAGQTLEQTLVSSAIPIQLAAIHVTMAFVCHLGWALVVDRLRGFVRRPGPLRAIEAGAGAALLYLAARTVLRS